jgi:ATP-binding cassette, subfamily B, bacterial
MAKFPFYNQYDVMDCGPTCLRMIAKHYGRNFSLQTLREKCFITREGVSLMGISDAAESIGFRTLGVTINFEQLSKEAPLPLVVHWNQNHFIVVYKTTKNKVYTADPAYGLISYSKQEFMNSWLSNKEKGENKGLALLLEPGPEFYNQTGEKINKSSFGFLFSYLKSYKNFLFQLLLGVFIGSILQLILPFLTQSIVDYGINNRDLGFIYLILIAQLVVVISRQTVDFIRGWILLHLSSRINISLISDFLVKLMKLPIGFFDSKLIGDILQRINDHRRIESFLTTSSLSILFSFFNLVIFSIVLGIYSLKILGVFVIGSVLYFLWINLFMKKRRELDFKRFMKMSDNQGKIIQIISGIEEIKLNNAERDKRWEWENVQSSLFKINIRSLSLHQYQMAGGVLINEVKNIVVTFLAASAVVSGEMTLGMMLAVSYILGQLNSPIEQMVGFLRSTQDAKISLERLGEIHENRNEEDESLLMKVEPVGKKITVKNLSFRYEGPYSSFVLKNLDLEIPENRVTAIVGTSGSGKTTLIKMLLGYYPPTEGEIHIGDQNLRNMSPNRWRQRCGVVLQNGYLFSDSIARNIALGENFIDTQKLAYSARLSNISEFIDSLPLGYNTKIGQEGQNLSGGEKQRILIARAIYKTPDFLFLDEGTSSLDANNERTIMQNLFEFYKSRTVIVVAHRLSTVRDAHQIVVLDKGSIVEKGTHEELSRLKGHYYNLVKNQLEMGS